MAGIDRTKPEDMKPIDAAAYLCWGSGRGDLYDAIHAMKKDNERMREALQKWWSYSQTDYEDHTKMMLDWADAVKTTRSALQQKETE